MQDEKAQVRTRHKKGDGSAMTLDWKSGKSLAHSFWITIAGTSLGQDCIEYRERVIKGVFNSQP